MPVILHKLNILLEETENIITPTDIYTTYYLSLNINNDDPAAKFTINHYLNLLQQKYLKTLHPLIIDQLKKYLARGRTDNIYTSEDLIDASAIKLHKFMCSTYRSDMHRRNVVWERFTENYAKLVGADDSKTILYCLDRLNNDIHNTDDLILTKLDNGLELERALNTAHNANSRELLGKSYRDARVA